MGRPRFLHRRLIGLAGLALLAACGGSEDDLLVAGDVDAIIYAGSGAGKYRVKDPNQRGTISGTVRFKGRVWRLQQIDMSSVKFCANENPGGLMSEDFLFDPKTGALEGVIVYIQKGLEGTKWDVPTNPVVLDQKGCQYIPHVAVLQAGQPLVIKSSDNTSHNVHGAPGPNREFNEGMPKPDELSPKYLTKTEVAKRIYCDVHGWMVSWLAVLPHPCWSITAKDGTFKIENVPAGTYLLAAWHEQRKLGELTAEITVKENGEVVTQDFLFERK